MSDVFVSYKREDRARVKPLVDALAAEGLSVWWDVGIEGGADWRQSIETALEDASCVIVVWSTLSVGPPGRFVQDEAGRAQRRGVYLPVHIDEVEPPLGFGGVQALSLIGWRGRRTDGNFQELVTAARAVAAGARRPIAARAPTPSGRWSRRWRPWWAWAGISGALLLVAGAWFAFDEFGSAPTPNRIAILPFETAGDDEAARSFADGVTDEVAGTLAKAEMPTLSLDAGRGSSSLDRDAAAVRGGAAYALGGRVQRDGGLLDVTVDIDDPREHQMLWSASFSRPAAEAPEMREQIATAIALVLQCAFEIINRPDGRFDHESVSLYLRACELKEDWHAGDKIRDLLRQVVRRQPRFATGWAKLAVADAQSELPPDQAAAAQREARAAADRALRLDPRNGIPYIALVDMVSTPGHLSERQSLILKGLSVSPDVAVLNSREADLLAEVGRIDDGIAFSQRAESLDPFNPATAEFLAGALGPAGRITEARKVIERAARLWPDDEHVLIYHLAAEARWGDPDRALALLADPKTRPPAWEASKVDEWRRFTLARKSRDPAKVAEYAREQLASLAAGRIGASEVVRQMVSLGATEAAFAAAGRATPADPLDTEPLFRATAEGMRRDPRFMPLVAKWGLVDFWRHTGKWPDFCEKPDRPYDCRAAAAKLTGVGQEAWTAKKPPGNRQKSPLDGRFPATA